MDTEIQPFLEDALAAVTSPFPGVGRLVVEPDYDAVVDGSKKAGLAAELQQVLAAHHLNEAALHSPSGDVIRPHPEHKLLATYIRTLTLHPDPVEGSWIEVAPPGNWI